MLRLLFVSHSLDRTVPSSYHLHLQNRDRRSEIASQVVDGDVREPERVRHARHPARAREFGNVWQSGNPRVATQYPTR
ncbi:MAG TPA: hypothetical protein VK427_12325 [Kofleriaceae bacterium]|nr:hypothetical protein [Kofleriaceae bacterium]